MWYEGVSKSFRTGLLAQELQMVQLFATSCTCIAILWVSVVSFVAITLCVASQRVFIVVSIYFVIYSVRKLLDTPSETRMGLYLVLYFLSYIRVHFQVPFISPWITEATRSPETLVSYHITTRRHSPEDRSHSKLIDVSEEQTVSRMNILNFNIFLVLALQKKITEEITGGVCLHF
jgi:hypothetical protein